MNTKAVKWCCSPFEWRYIDAGQRGIGILIGRDSTGEAAFTLQTRMVDKGEEQAVHSDTLASLVIDQGIDYCPWCGRYLKRFYKSQVDQLYRPGLKIAENLRPAED